MLKTRIITAICLIALVLTAFMLPDRFFMPLVFLLILAAAWEYARLVAIPTLIQRVLFVIVIALSFFIYLHGTISLMDLYGVTSNPSPVVVKTIAVINRYIPIAPIMLGAAWWIFATIMLFIFPKGHAIWHRSVLLRAIVGWLILIPCAVSIVSKRDTLFLLLLIWSADTGAYFAGRYFGKHLLAPLVSPKKTWEGVAGGFLMTALTASIIAYFWLPSIFAGVPALLFPITVIVIFIFSVIGDLVESGIKRWMNVKDSGTLLPGHGGLLDRIDSLTAAAPMAQIPILLYLWPY